MGDPQGTMGLPVPAGGQEDRLHPLPSLGSCPSPNPCRCVSRLGGGGGGGGSSVLWNVKANTAVLPLALWERKQNCSGLEFCQPHTQRGGWGGRRLQAGPQGQPSRDTAVSSSQSCLGSGLCSVLFELIDFPNTLKGP